MLDPLRDVRDRSPFYRAKYGSKTFERWEDVPYTTKAELAADQERHPPYGSNHTRPITEFVRMHQTSGTSTGKPLRWLDTRDGWAWLLECWRSSFPDMGLSPNDRIFFPFSFGPFLGFWTAFEAASGAGFLCLPGGGLTSTARLRFLMDHAATVVFCTPTYALYLAELAKKEGIDLAQSSVTKLVVAGEPGGAIPATRERIESVWGARVFDHYGMTEIGPVAVETLKIPRDMRLLDTGYFFETLDTGSEYSELIITNFPRSGCPLIRYRTGDLVKREGNILVGGILGRADDMLHVRGNNLYPGSLEAIVRKFPEVVEYRLVVDRTGPLPDLAIEVEADASVADAVARAVRDELLFRVEVLSVPAGSLPRFELKARRVVHKS